MGQVVSTLAPDKYCCQEKSTCRELCNKGDRKGELVEKSWFSHTCTQSYVESVESPSCLVSCSTTSSTAEEVERKQKLRDMVKSFVASAQSDSMKILMREGTSRHFLFVTMALDEKSQVLNLKEDSYSIAAEEAKVHCVKLCNAEIHSMTYSTSLPGVWNTMFSDLQAEDRARAVLIVHRPELKVAKSQIRALASPRPMESEDHFERPRESLMSIESPLSPEQSPRETQHRGSERRGSVRNPLCYTAEDRQEIAKHKRESFVSIPQDDEAFCLLASDERRRFEIHKSLAILARYAKHAKLLEDARPKNAVIELDPNAKREKAVKMVVRVIVEHDSRDANKVMEEIMTSKKTGWVRWKGEQVATWDNETNTMLLQSEVAQHQQAFDALMADSAMDHAVLQCPTGRKSQQGSEAPDSEAGNSIK